MAENFAGENALRRDLTTLVAWFNETLGKAETKIVRKRLATDAAFDALAGEFTEFTIARNVLRENPRLAVEPVLKDIRAMWRKGPRGPVDLKYVLAVRAVCCGVPEEEEEAENLRFAEDKALFAIFMRLVTMDAFCYDLHMTENPAQPGALAGSTRQTRRIGRLAGSLVTTHRLAWMIGTRDVRPAKK